MIGAVSIVETRRAGRDDDGRGCSMCPDPLVTGQRIALVRSDDTGHGWVHVKCVITGRITT